MGRALRVGGNAYAYGYRHAALIGFERLDGDRLTQCFSQSGAALQLGVGKDNAEFLAADTGRKVSAADTLFQNKCQLSQDLVAGIMAVCVIYFFKIVNVTDEKTEATIAQCVEKFSQMSAVGKSC